MKCVVRTRLSVPASPPPPDRKVSTKTATFVLVYIVDPPKRPMLASQGISQRGGGRYSGTNILTAGEKYSVGFFYLYFTILLSQKCWLPNPLLHILKCYIWCWKVVGQGGCLWGAEPQGCLLFFLSQHGWLVHGRKGLSTNLGPSVMQIQKS